MGKSRVADFDADVCVGERSDVQGACPHLVGDDGQEDDGVLGWVATMENRAIEAMTGEEQFSCGMCGCPLTNLSAFNVAPDDCPRREQHNR